MNASHQRHEKLHGDDKCQNSGFEVRVLCMENRNKEVIQIEKSSPEGLPHFAKRSVSSPFRKLQISEIDIFRNEPLEDGALLTF